MLGAAAVVLEELLGAAAVAEDALWSGVVLLAEVLGAAAALWSGVALGDGVVEAAELLCAELMLPAAGAAAAAVPVWSAEVLLLEAAGAVAEAD